MTRLPFAVCALVCAVSAFAQVSVREPETKARLVNGKTTISLALSNTASKPVDAIILLGWIDPNDTGRDLARITPRVAAGDSQLDIAVPLPDKLNPLLLRLRYEILPGDRNYTSFLPAKGALSFANIAGYAFALNILSSEPPMPGKTYDIPVFALHPVTGLPISGVEVHSGKSIAVSDRNGLALLHVDVPPEDSGESVEFPIAAHLGDCNQHGQTTSLSMAQDDVRIYSDKPLYQPGQTMHIRILARSSAGPVRAGVEHEISVVDEAQETVHTEAVTTSRFGVASADWDIPTNAKDGQYRIEVKRDDLEDPFARTVSIRRYELPSFRVSAKPDHPFYLPGQPPVIEVSAEYLFGKPVATGAVRITEGDETKAVAEGKLNRDGNFRAMLTATSEVAQKTKYIDRNFTAYVTDSSTNRTEQRKFDVRVSRDRLHIYLPKGESTAEGERLYISVYTPDGKPAIEDVRATAGGRLLAAGKTNRWGVAKIELPPSDYKDVTVSAGRADGALSQEILAIPNDGSTVWLDTDHTLYRSGQPVRCHVSATLKNLPVALVAWNDAGQIVYSKALALTNGSVDVEIPYDPRFGRKLGVGVVSGATQTPSTRQVIFPGQDELMVRAIPVKSTFHPGETAAIQFHASAESALGIAIVDQSVLERAVTDQEFQRQRWFDYDSDSALSIGGVTQRDLLNIDPAKIDGDLELVAAALLPGPSLIDSAEDLIEQQRNAFTGAGAKMLAPLEKKLETHFLETLDYPRDEAALGALLGHDYWGLTDPWMRPWFAKFTTEGAYDVIRFLSAGPDKQRGTADDYSALEIKHKWFANFERLIRDRLRLFVDYPASSEEFARALEDAGIRFAALRDPWGSALRAAISYDRDQREIQIRSAGPDRTFDTSDDFTVAEFAGPYFATASRRIGDAVSAAAEFPRTEAQLRATLKGAGIDFDSLRDPWGRPYFAAFRTEESFRDNVQVYSYSEYNGTPEQRKQLTPVKRTILVLEIRSAGEDGIPGTYDDFEVAAFTRILDEGKPEPAPEEKATLPVPPIGGTGTIAGTVTDASGAEVPNTRLVLNDLYMTRTDKNGRYVFAGLRPAVYRLRLEAAGFQSRVIDRVPVFADHLTRADAVLNVGSVTETVEVVSPAPVLNADMASAASMASPGALSTPRVREYFPETLYWQPELITDTDGRALIHVKLADSVTTWHVAAIASTVDGRIAETGADIRAFQPFLMDLDAPPVLTMGDEIVLPVPVRNYLDQPQKVTVSAAVPKQLLLRQAVDQPGIIEPSSSANARLFLRAASQGADARLRVSGAGQAASDAIEKPVSIHPDGERREVTVNGVASDGRPLRIEVPGGGVIDGSLQAEVKFYPSLLARLLESMEALLTRPYGCGEQTISSTYPNLFFLRAMSSAHIDEQRLRVRAMKNLLSGYQRLLGYQDDSGGFTYWGHGEPDVALTAYAVSFLQDAAGLIAVDEDRVDQAQKWLARQNAPEPSVRALQLRTLAHAGAGKLSDLDSMLGELARRAAEFEDPYAIAVFALAAMEAGKMDAARPALERLSGMSREEQGAAFWSLRANSPFHGWGRSGQVETTALAVSALARWRKLEGASKPLDTLLDRGVLFLLKNADHSGAWSTTQSSVRALEALLDVWAGVDSHKGFSVNVLVNGTRAGTVSIPGGNVVRGPVVVDVSRFLQAGANEIAFAGGGSAAIQTQVNATWYETWDKPERATSLHFESQCGPDHLTVNQAANCNVLISRPNFRGYGMAIAEIGLPPGAEVDRGTLANVVDDPKSGVDSFEVAPDHVTFYIWPRAADSQFHFAFRPRFSMKARSAQSVLYDYYNPEERVVLAPTTFTVE